MQHSDFYQQIHVSVGCVTHAIPLAGAGSIVEVYTAVLLGFLIEGSPSLQKTAAALLPTHSVGPVVAAIARCLDFYVRTGAMTKKNEDSLRHLLASLEKDSSVCKQVKAG